MATRPTRRPTRRTKQQSEARRGARRKFQHRPLPPAPTESINPDLLYTQEEAAGFLRLSDRTLEAWRADESGPTATRFGRRVRHFGRDLLAFAAKRTGAAA
jgi:hypothetical protein